MSRMTTLAVMGAIVALSACKDFTSSGDPLTEAEAAEMADLIASRGFPGTGGVANAPPAAAPSDASAPADNITITINDSGPCEGGGTVSLAGTLRADVNQQTHVGELDYEFTLTPNACVVNAEGGKTFTLSGEPNLKADGKLDWSSTGFNGEFDYNGKFNWTASDGRAGTCGVDLKATLNAASSGTTGSFSASLTGTVCGITVNRNLSVSST